MSKEERPVDVESYMLGRKHEREAIRFLIEEMINLGPLDAYKAAERDGLMLALNRIERLPQPTTKAG